VLTMTEAIFKHVGWRWRGPHGGWIYDDKKPAWHAEAVYVFEERKREMQDGDGAS
jgi:hypothetical protein